MKFILSLQFSNPGSFFVIPGSFSVLLSPFSVLLSTAKDLVNLSSVILSKAKDPVVWFARLNVPPHYLLFRDSSPDGSE